MSANDVRDMMDLGSAGPRPAKKQKLTVPRPNLKGLAREVQSLGGDNPIAIVPEVSLFKKRRIISRKPAAKWELKPFKNSARKEDSLVLRHWKKKTEVVPAPVGEDGNPALSEPLTEQETEDSTFAKFSVNVNIPRYDDEQYKAQLESEDWTRSETDYLMNLAQEYDLRWPVIWDRYEYEPPAPEVEDSEAAIIPLPKPRNLEQLKDRYYKIAAQTMKAATPLELMNHSEFDTYEKMSNFNPAQETNRKAFAEKAFTRTRDEAREEESLLLELKRILGRSEKMNEERREIYARLEAPPSTGNIGVYTTSQGLQQLLQQLMTVDKTKKRRSLMGLEGISPATGPNGLQQYPVERRDSSFRESISGSSNLNAKKGSIAGPSEYRQLTEEEERIYGVSHPNDRGSSGPIFRHEKLSKPLTSKSANIQLKVTNTLQELQIPTRLIMPTAETGTLYSTLIDGIIKMLSLRTQVEKAAGEVALVKAQKAEREKLDRIARGEPELEGEEDAEAKGDGGGDGNQDVEDQDSDDQDGDVKTEDGEKEKSVAPSVKRSASVLSSVSDKSNKRQKK